MMVVLAGAMLAAAAGQSSPPKPTTTATLRAELDDARAQIAAQKQQLDSQEARLRALEAKLATPAPALASAAPAIGRAPGATQPPAALAQGSSASTPGDPATIQQSTVQQVGQRPADRDRPPEVAVLGSEGSVVTRRGQLTAEVQLDYARADRNRALFRGIEVVESVLIGAFNINESRQDVITGSLAARYGLTDNLELGVRVPVVHRADASVLVPVQGSTNNDAAREVDSAAQGNGIGDIELSARYQLLSGRRGWPFIVGNVQLVVPTGSNPFSVPRSASGEELRAATGAGFWGVSPSVTAILPSDPAVLFGTIGYTHNFGRSVDTQIPPVRVSYVKPGDALSFSAGIGIALNERTSLNLGYAHTWAFGTRTTSGLIDPGPTDPGPTTALARDLQLGRLLFGVTYRTTDRTSVNWSVELGATDDAPDVRSVLRLPLTLLAGH